LPATFFASVALPAIIVVTAIVAFIGLFWIQAARVTGWVDWLLLKYFVLVVQGFAAIPSAAVGIGTIPTWLVYAYYAFVASAMGLWSELKRHLPARPTKKGPKPKRTPMPAAAKWAIGALSLIALLIWVAVFATPATGKLQVSFIDVGQGDSILITSPTNEHILVDGGPNPDTDCLAVGEALPFWEHSIDMVVLTHPHDDHAGGLVEIARRYDVKEVLAPPDCFLKSENASASPAYYEFRQAIAGKHIESIAAQQGQTIDIGGGATIEVLNPPATPLIGTTSDVDNNGVVLHVTMGNISFLLTADMYADGELRLVYDRADIESTVLKAGHHGSGSATDSEFLDTVDPQAAVISVGANNSFGLPNASTVARLARAVGSDMVFTTMDQGTITLSTDGKRLWVEAER
jgi:competence protein ComEC